MMDRLLLILDQNKIDPSVSADNRDAYFLRRAARVVLYDENSAIALMYAAQKDYYKLPGGGIDDGEEVQQALERELMEETGCVAKIVKELGIVEEWRDSDSMHQVSYAFSATKTAQDSLPNFTQSEIDEGFELRWVKNIDEAIRLTESNAQRSDVSVSFMAQRDTAILRESKLVHPSF